MLIKRSTVYILTNNQKNNFFCFIQYKPNWLQSQTEKNILHIVHSNVLIVTYSNPKMNHIVTLYT